MVISITAEKAFHKCKPIQGLKKKLSKTNGLPQLLFNIALLVLSIIIRKEKEIRSINTGNAMKLSLFADDTIVYIG